MQAWAGEEKAATEENPAAPGGQALAAAQEKASPAPPTHAILTRLKAGESVCQTLFVPKLEFQTLKTLCQTLFVPKTASETLFLRPSMVSE